MKFIIQYKNQYIKVKANEKYFHNYINCATENGIIGYPIQYCPICGEKT